MHLGFIWLQWEENINFYVVLLFFVLSPPSTLVVPAGQAVHVSLETLQNKQYCFLQSNQSNRMNVMIRRIHFKKKKKSKIHQTRIECGVKFFIGGTQVGRK